MCTRDVFFFFNFLQFLTGTAIIVVGSFSLDKGREFDILYSWVYITLSAIGVASGVLTIIFTSVGCIGAFKEKKSTLFWYGGLELLLLLIQITVFVLLIVYGGEVAELVPSWMRDIFKKYGQGDDDLDNSLNDVQEALQCCGVIGYEDWKEFPYQGVSDGCCVNRFKDCGRYYFTNPYQPEIWETGCASAMKDALSVLLMILSGVIGLVALFQIICCIIAFAIASRIKMTKSQSTTTLYYNSGPIVTL
ncbi:unnamed protein product [Meganyctiphanes norvegica]|uniref:Tetraspanin n=1 Tax=Meganyctiphanes norvegica TaxID=48144 RepID=A0AAV2SD96_MEGNR